MKRCIFGVVGAALLLTTGCDWSGGGGEDFNSSRGGANINISGYFRGQMSGRAVSNTTGGPIGSFTIQQSGNRIDVIDNNGSSYTGTVGSPSAVASPDANGVLPAGASLSNFQVSWTGTDGTAGKNIEFSGVITLVAVSDIQGDSTVRTITNNSGTSSTNTTGEQQLPTVVTDTTTETTDTRQDVREGQEGALREVVTETVTISGDTIDRSDTTSSENSDNSTRTITTTFQITGNNSQMRLQGTWVEAGGTVSKVDALSAGAAGGITVTN